MHCSDAEGKLKPTEIYFVKPLTYLLSSQDTDKTVRIECVFTADDQTVSFRPTAGGREDGGGISVTSVSDILI